MRVHLHIIYPPYQTCTIIKWFVHFFIAFHTSLYLLFLNGLFPFVGRGQMISGPITLCQTFYVVNYFNNPEFVILIFWGSDFIPSTNICLVQLMLAEKIHENICLFLQVIQCYIFSLKLFIFFFIQLSLTSQNIQQQGIFILLL